MQGRPRTLPSQGGQDPLPGHVAQGRLLGPFWVGVLIKNHPSSIYELLPHRVPGRESGTVGLQGANMGGYCHLVANLPHSISNLWS